MRGLQHPLRNRPDGKPYPRKAWVVQIETQGHTEEEIIANLEFIITEAVRGRTSWQSVGCGSIVSCDVDESITPEDHQKALNEYMEYEGKRIKETQNENSKRSV